MKILVVGPTPPPIGGVAHVVETFLSMPKLHERHEIRHFSTAQPRAPVDWGRPSVANACTGFAQVRGFSGSLREFRPDLVHLHTSLGLAMHKALLFLLKARRVNARVLLHIHSGGFDEWYRNAVPISRQLARYTLSRSDAVIVLSQSWKDVVATIVPGQLIHVLRNPVNRAFFGLRRGSPRPDDSTRIFFLGRIGHAKGTPELVRAAHLVAEAGVQARFVLAGVEDHHGDLKIVERCMPGAGRDSVRFVGELSGDDRIRALTDTDIFTLPSRKEGLPVSLLEAMATGLPVITTPVGGIPEVVRDGENGLLVPPGDASALAQAILALVRDPDRRARMGEVNARKIAAAYAPEAVERGLLVIYEEMERPAPSRAPTELVESGLAHRS